MNILSSSLFHFTGKTPKNGIDVLKSIIKEGFRVSYCQEILFDDLVDNYPLSTPNKVRNYFNPDRPSNKDYEIPMVSFCNIPLKNISQHTIKYGKYGIGLKNEWAVKNSLNPLLYISRNSVIAHEFKTYSKLDEIKDEPDDIYNSQFFDGFLKIYKPSINRFYHYDSFGKIYKNIHLYIKAIGLEETGLGIDGKRIVNYQEEMEWRYCPKYAYIKKISIPEQNISKYHIHHKSYNDIINSFPISYPNLKFSWDDISHILVEKDEDIKDFTDFIRKKKYVPYEEEGTFFSKIVSFETFERDF